MTAENYTIQEQNEELRAENLELRSQIKRLQNQIANLEFELRTSSAEVEILQQLNQARLELLRNIEEEEEVQALQR